MFSVKLLVFAEPVTYMIGHQLVDSELVHAELTKAGSALVDVLFSIIFMQVRQKTVSSASL